jgi:hypothetical protein
MSQSPFITELLSRTARTARPTSAATQPVRDVEKQPRLTRYDGPTEAEADAADYILRGDNPTVLFGMYLCFAMASAANFGSLVTFNPVNGDAACGAFFTPLYLCTLSYPPPSLRRGMGFDVHRARQDRRTLYHQSPAQAPRCG